MSSDNFRLTVQDGFPIQGFDQNRDGQKLDLQEVNARWYELGLELALENDVGAQYTSLYNEHLAQGNHPEVCYQYALDTLGIEWREDTFFVTYKNETIDIDNS